MAHIQRRRGVKGGWSYRVRYTDPDGREKSRTFARKADADDFLVSIEHSMRAGSYVDPGAGRQTVRAYLEEWRLGQSHHRPSSAAITKTRFQTMVYPHLGDTPIGRLRPSAIRAWQATLLQTYSPATVKGVRGQVAGAFKAAVADRRISSSPFQGVKAPEVPRRVIVPLTVGQVRAGEAAMVERYRAAIPLVAGSGLRRGEVFGLTVDRVDFLRRRIRVDRQLLGRRGPDPVFGPPKTASSDRTVPVGRHVIAALSAHLARYPAGPTDLVFRTSRGTPVTREVFGVAWAPAARAMGLGPRQGLHQLRHFYASLLIAAGRPVKEVQERLGHASAVETLDTYAHLWHHSEDGTRDAVDAAFDEADRVVGSGSEGSV